MSKKLIAAAVAAFSFAACTDTTPPPKVVKTVVAPVIPSVIAVAPHDAGAPVVAVFEVPTVIDSLVLTHETGDVDHLGRANALSSEGDVRGALIEARRALFTTPSDVETLTTVAKLARRAGQPAMAAEAWSRVAAIETTDAEPLIQQARALMQLKDHEGAMNAGREASTRDPGNAEAFQVTGIAQLAMRDLPGSIASFEKAIEVDPKHGWALNNLGLAYLRANENEKAVDVLERSAALLPSVAFVHNNLGVALERVGKKDEAKIAYQQAMDLSPKYVKARLNADRVAKLKLDDALIDDSTEQVHPMIENQ